MSKEYEELKDFVKKGFGDMHARFSIVDSELSKLKENIDKLEKCLNTGDKKSINNYYFGGKHE